MCAIQSWFFRWIPVFSSNAYNAILHLSAFWIDDRFRSFSQTDTVKFMIISCVHILFPDLHQRRRRRRRSKMKCAKWAPRIQLWKNKWTKESHRIHLFRSILGVFCEIQKIYTWLNVRNFFSNLFISYPHSSCHCDAYRLDRVIFGREKWKMKFFQNKTKKNKRRKFSTLCDLCAVIVSDFSWWLLHAIVHTDNKVRKENNYNK